MTFRATMPFPMSNHARGLKKLGCLLPTRHREPLHHTPAGSQRIMADSNLARVALHPDRSIRTFEGKSIKKMQDCHFCIESTRLLMQKGTQLS
jgi:hypothetical protein